jgi:hypothetical protein
MRMQKALGATSLLAAALVIAPTPSRAANATAEDLLNGIRDDAATIRVEADHMQVFVSRTAQAAWLNHVRHAVNDMGVKADRLSEMQSSLDPIELREFCEVSEMGPKIAKETSAAIEFLNNSPGLLWTGTYHDMTVRLYADAASLSHSVDAYNDLHTVQAKEKKLEKDVGTPAD